ncbi:MAG: prepilin-type N-terminal cleavage/methylation domain-containing protein [Desulforhopalus sp.]|jgi:prepilin-type N-terminal cleavage/methylation domain-containing protein|nr:prepilin-type N-terminal cleavage/methylation domain-containing protein [Desulforhopalus sp.]
MLLPLHRLFWGSPERVRDEKGFTLIELIVVTFLIGIMLSISIPSLRNTFFTDPLKASTRKIIGLVTGVRELAARSQQPYLLHISQMENRIWYEKEVEGEKKQENDTLQPEELLLSEAVKITEVSVSDSDGSSQDHIVIWVSKQGFISEMIIRIEDNDGNHLNVRFYTFLDPAIVSDQVVPF